MLMRIMSFATGRAYPFVFAMPGRFLFPTENPESSANISGDLLRLSSPQHPNRDIQSAGTFAAAPALTFNCHFEHVAIA